MHGPNQPTISSVCIYSILNKDSTFLLMFVLYGTTRRKSLKFPFCSHTWHTRSYIFMGDICMGDPTAPPAATISIPFVLVL